jgi:hypothetical protein
MRCGISHFHLAAQQQLVVTMETSAGADVARGGSLSPVHIEYLYSVINKMDGIKNVLR